MSKYVEGLVSVIIPTYKRSMMLERSIESILNQTYSFLEVILVNDNDPDDDYTKEVKKRIARFQHDIRFRFIIQKKHINGAVARNVGIRSAKGEFIAFLDDDDWWMPDKIEKQIKVLQNLDKEWGGVSCKFCLYNNQGKVIGKTSKYDDGYIYKDVLFLLSDVATGTLLLRHEALDFVGYFDENLKRHQDVQLLVNFTYHYKLKEIDAFLHCVDVSDTNNRANAQNILNIKRDFFESVAPIIRKLNKKERTILYSIHAFEIGYIQLKSGMLFDGLKNIIKIFTNYTTFKYALKKIKIKIFLRLNTF